MEDNLAKQKQVSAILVGGGSRGSVLASYALDQPEKLKITAVVDPKEFARKKHQKLYSIDDKNLFPDWPEVIALEGRLADCVIIATPDRFHKEPAIAFAKKGYHIFLEKPMAVTPSDCRDIVAACKKYKVILSVGHVLRYSESSVKIKQLIQDGTIGDVINIQLIEPVGYYHFAHSFVRGNWRNEACSGFSLLTKSCHDIDLIADWMKPAKCTQVSSFGSLLHFRKEDKPKDAGTRCLDCPIEQSCPYSAKRIYLERVEMGCIGWPNDVVTDVVDIENMTEALKTGPYGRCVYDCDNDVMTNQVVNMQFDGGQTASFTMVAFMQSSVSREVRISGTRGELRCSIGGLVRHFDFLTHEIKHHSCNESDLGAKMIRQHGGGDFHIIGSFVEAVAKEDPSFVTTNADDTLASHLLVFAAERARVENRVVQINENPIN